MKFGDALASMLRGRGRAPVAPAVQAKGDAFATLVSGANTFRPPAPNQAALLAYYNDNPNVRSIVGRVADAVADQPWHLTDKRTGERIDNHPALAFLRRGNSRLRGRSGVRLSIVYRDTAGDVFWVIGRDTKGKPASFAPIPPTWVTTVPVGDEPDGGWYEVQPTNGSPISYPARDVIWMRDPNPLDPYARGKGMTHAAKSEIAADEAAADYLGAFFKNYARPDLLVSGTDAKPLDEAGASRLKLQWRNLFQGAKKAGQPLISGSELSVKEIGASLKDNDVAPIRKSLSEVLRSVYGVSPEILGQTTSSNRATADAASYMFGKYVVKPRLSWLQEELEPWLDEQFDLKGQFELCFESPIDEDREPALKAMTAKPAAFSKNEWRRMANLPPVEGEGFDDYPEEPDPAELAAAAAGQKPGAKPLGQEPKKEPPNGPASEKAFAEQLLKSASPETIITISRAHEEAQVAAEITSIFEAAYAAAVKRYGVALLAELQSDVQFQLNAEVAGWLKTEAPETLGQMSRTTAEALEKTLVEGAAKNEAVATLLKRIDALYEDAATVRGAIASQTMATKLAGFSTLTASKQAGFSGKKWLNTGDHKVRSSHNSLNGQIKALGDKFVSPAGNRADHPGAFQVASEDINCRCAIRPVLAEEDQGSKSATPISDQDFEAFYTLYREEIADKLKQIMVKAFATQRAATVAAATRLLGG